jgi:tetratricopeptide (TPR) repeat protein
MNPEILAGLRTVLAKLYAEEPDIRRLIADAGLDVARINLDSAAINDWQAVLEEAEKVGRTEALLAVIEQEYGENAEFQAACHACRVALAQISLTPDHGVETLTSGLPESVPQTETTHRKSRPLQGKSKVEVAVIVALIGAIATIAASLINFLSTRSPPIPTGEQAANVIVEPTVTPFATPVILPRSVSVRVAQFDQCGTAELTTDLIASMRPYLRKATINLDSLSVAINSRGQAHSQSQTNIVIWGRCTEENNVTFYAELNTLHSQSLGRVAEPESIQVVGKHDALEMPAKTLAAAILYTQQTSTEETVALLKQTAAQWQPTGEISLHWLLGNALLGHREASFAVDAVQEYKTIISLWEKAGQQDEQQYALIYNNLGIAYTKMEKFPDAISAFNQANQADPSMVWVYLSRSEAYARNGQFATAEADCKHVLALDPVQGYTCRALVNYQDGKLANISSDGQQANALDPNDAFTQIISSLVACEQGDMHSALDRLNVFYAESFAHLNRWQRDHSWVATVAAGLTKYYHAVGCNRTRE